VTHRNLVLFFNILQKNFPSALILWLGCEYLVSLLRYVQFEAVCKGLRSYIVSMQIPHGNLIHNLLCYYK